MRANNGAIALNYDGSITCLDLWIDGRHTKEDILYLLGHVNAASDIRLKKNISNTNINALSILNQLEFKQWDWKENNKHENFGLIADDLEKIIPEAVNTYGTDGIKTITPGTLTYYNTKAIQEAYKELKEENKQMKEIINNLLERIEKLENKEDK